MQNPIVLNQDQKNALETVFNLLTSEYSHAMVLSGVAGSGKTTLLSEVVKLATDMGLKCRALSPTGKAAKTLEAKLNQLLPKTFTPFPVCTIHQYLYSLLTPGHYVLNPPMEKFDLLIVDEASMISDAVSHNAYLRFGSGKLLTDLLTLVKNVYRQGDRLRPVKVLFVGDPFQLPPVKSNHSPAMTPLYLMQRHQLAVINYHLTQVVRQAEGSGILTWANQIRDDMDRSRNRLLRVPFNGKDIRKTTALKAMELLAAQDPLSESCVAIVATNLMAWEYNLSVRQLRWGASCVELQVGEKLLVRRNAPSLGLSNGELVTVVEAGNHSTTETVTLENGSQIALTFRRVTLAVSKGIDELNKVYAVVLENYLYEHLSERDSRQIEEALRIFLSDPSHQSLYNQLLQVKFGYALTCHKAQGSEWPQVIIDPTGIDTRTLEGKQWLYTAVTRSSGELEVVT